MAKSSRARPRAAARRLIHPDYASYEAAELKGKLGISL